jgi:MFS superfamily sulfate permease-like transporter
VVFDAAGQDSLDLTSAEVLKGLYLELKGKGIDLYVADLHGPVLESGKRMGLTETIGEDHIFPTVDAAVRFIEMSVPAANANLT